MLRVIATVILNVLLISATVLCFILGNSTGNSDFWNGGLVFLLVEFGVAIISVLLIND